MLFRTMIVATLIVGFIAPPSPTRVLAGDGVYRVSGRVIACSTDLSTEPINSAIPPSCNTDVEQAVVTVTASQPSAESFPISASTATDGSFLFSPGSPDTFSIVVQTDLDLDFNAGFLSCIYQELDGAYAGESVFALDANGAAEIFGGAPLWFWATCNFFLYSAAPGESSLTASVLECDVDIRANPDPPLVENCPLVGSLLLTQMTFPDGTSQQQTTDGQGNVTYSGLLSGQNYSISIDRSSFYDGTIAFCTESSADGTILVNEVTIEGTAESAIPLSIQNPGAVMRCTIAVFPKVTTVQPDTDGEPGMTDTVTIDIGKYDCPTDFGAESIDEYWNNCDLTFDSVVFDIYGNRTGESRYQATGDIADGVVIFEGLSPDDWQISEQKPDGYGEPVVYCSTVSQDESFRSDYAPVIVYEGNAIIEVVDEGTDLSCEWFNIPESAHNSSSGTGSSESNPTEDRSFQISLFTCPFEYDAFADDADPDLDCDEEVEGVSFSATDLDGGSTRETTDSSGGAFIDLSAASGEVFAIEQKYPAEVQASFIWKCELNGQEIESPFQPVFELSKSNLLHVTIENGDELSCVWMNLPTESRANDSGETSAEAGVFVSVAVLECPGIPNPAACDASEEGFNVILTDTSDSELEFALETGADGFAAGEIPVGEYELSADLTPCFVDSLAFTEDGTLLLEADIPVDLTLFVCN